MKNIYEILKNFEITVPEDKKKEFDNLILENYKTIKEVNNLQGKLENAEKERDTYKTKYDEDIQQRDADIKDLQTKLKNAGTDADKLKTLEADLATLQTNYDTAKTEYEKQLAQQAYEFAVKEKVSSLKFSSNSAKKAFIADAMNEGMKLKDGELQGFNEFLESYKKNDAGAFLTDTPAEPPKKDDNPKPYFSGKSTGLSKEPESEGETGSEKNSVTFW